MLPCGNSICLLAQTRYIAARCHPERSRTFAPRFRLTVFVAASQFDSLRSLRMTQAQKRKTKSQRDLGQQFDIRLRREYALSPAIAGALPRGEPRGHLIRLFALRQKSTCLAAARARRGSDTTLWCHSTPRRRFATQRESQVSHCAFFCSTYWGWGGRYTKYMIFAIALIIFLLTLKKSH